MRSLDISAIFGSLLVAARAALAAPADGAPAAGHLFGPPPEAIEACAGKAEGSEASLTLPDGRTVAATCHEQKGVMAARPSPPAEAITACEGKVEGDPVSVTAPGGRKSSGTCRVIDGVLSAAPADGPPQT